MPKLRTARENARLETGSQRGRNSHQIGVLGIYDLSIQGLSYGRTELLVADMRLLAPDPTRRPDTNQPPWGGGVPQGAAPGASGEEFGGVRDCAGPGAIIPPGKKKGPCWKLIQCCANLCGIASGKRAISTNSKSLQRNSSSLIRFSSKTK